MAITIVKLFDNDISEKVIQDGLTFTSWPGRFQRMNKNLPIYYDVAHNAESIKSVLEQIKIIFKEKPLGLFVLKGNKELDLISNVIKNNFYTSFLALFF